MRKVWWAASLAFGLALTGSASAQTNNGFSTRQLQNVPVNTAAHTSPGFSGSSLTNYLPFLSRFSAKSTFGSSTFPGPDGMPGKNYLMYFGFSRAQPIK